MSIIDDYEKTILNVKNSLKNDGTFVILDFYKWKGIMKFFYPILKWWLNKFGVEPEKNIGRILKKNFKEVYIKILNSGYNFIAVAKYPKKNI
ncbi:hypothetical protein HYS72_02310 [Candidatus Pacearchaeota archaeon]|nr:hypothetical protein [Candidatus Pacearchaeota archaeon]